MATGRRSTRASASARRTAPTRKRSTTRAAKTTSRRSGSSASRSRATRSPFVLILVAAMLAVTVWSLYPVVRLHYQQQREVASLEQELAGLKSRNASLREQVDRLKTPEGIEQAARDNLGLVKPGEQAYVVTGGSIAGTEPTPLSAEESETPLVQRILDALLGAE